MHPEIMQNGSGNCPKCRMVLVPVKEAVIGSASYTQHMDNSPSMDHTAHDLINFKFNYLHNVLMA